MASKEELLYEKVLKDNLNINLGDDLTPNDLNCEKLVEKAIAKAGNLKWVGEDNLPWDYECDKSDSKTSSVAQSVSYKGTITSTESKEGALRCTITNDFSSKKIDYFFIPIKDVRKLESSVGGKKNSSGVKKKISYTYSVDKDDYGRIEPYRCNSFEEMCNKK
jgi:hypothetical protein